MELDLCIVASRCLNAVVIDKLYQCCQKILHEDIYRQSLVLVDILTINVVGWLPMSRKGTTQCTARGFKSAKQG